MKRFSDWSVDRSRRYRLARIWGSGPIATVIALNPSTADDHHDDPTNRRLIALLAGHGLAGYWLVNLLPDAQTDPRKIQWKNRRLSHRNRAYIEEAIQASEYVILAWGALGSRLVFRQQIIEMAEEPWCFGLTQGGEPRHPLYLPRSTLLRRYNKTAIF
jgi:hypothetical protein